MNKIVIGFLTMAVMAFGIQGLIDAGASKPTAFIISISAALLCYIALVKDAEAHNEIN